MNPESKNPRSTLISIITGIIVTVVGGVILAYIIQADRFDPTRQVLSEQEKINESNHTENYVDDEPQEEMNQVFLPTPLPSHTPDEGFPPEEISQGLIAFYPFDGDAIDASSNTLHGKLFNTWPGENRLGMENSSLYFDGYSAYVELPSETQFYNQVETISLWIKFNRLGPSAIISKSDGDEGLGLSEDNKLVYYLWDEGLS